MTSPMTKEEIDRVRNGKLLQATIPVRPSGRLKAHDQVTFKEAVFDAHQIPTLVSQGDSVTVTFTKARNTGSLHGSSRLFAVEWDPPSAA
jgi:hypothetical protein